jgi:hypothetical protein
MTGGRAYLYDPNGRHAAALNGGSVAAVRLAGAAASRPDGAARVTEFLRLVELQREAGSELAARLLGQPGLEDAVWLVEPVAAPAVAVPVERRVAQPVVTEPSRPFVAAG